MVNAAQKRAIKIGIASAGLGLAAFFATSTAHADTIGIPGNTDNDCVGYTNQLAATGQLTPDFECVHYPADIWPKEPLTMDVATDIAADNAQAIYNSDPGRFDTCRGYSEGTAGCLKLAQRVPIQVVLDGDPYGSTGAFNNPLVQVISPIIDAFGIPQNLPEPPGTVRNFNDRDVWANGGPQSPVGLIDQAANLQDHSVQGGTPDETWVDDQGVTNHEWHSGDPLIVNGPADSPAPTVSSTPGFAGEAPCVAPDGSQYFTAGDAPC